MLSKILWLLISKSAQRINSMCILKCTKKGIKTLTSCFMYPESQNIVKFPEILLFTPLHITFILDSSTKSRSDVELLMSKRIKTQSIKNMLKKALPCNSHITTRMVGLVHCK